MRKDWVVQCAVASAGGQCSATVTAHRRLDYLAQLDEPSPLER
jgi:hypothetical protein